jgi:hypothetical protein
VKPNPALLPHALLLLLQPRHPLAQVQAVLELELELGLVLVLVTRHRQCE